MMERLIRSLKEQCPHRHRFESLAHAGRVIGDGIQFYTHRRPGSCHADTSRGIQISSSTRADSAGSMHLFAPAYNLISGIASSAIVLSLMRAALARASISAR
ncbi:hypothetical protein [Albidovulum sediminicola]|uniref:hypothetical protein n=1 Tax=Albidovulum sediminicola TaxID=2984331 RepID=UPI003993C6C1